MRKLPLILMISVFLSGCMSSGFSTGLARGMSDETDREPPRQTGQTPDFLGDYYERQARRADRETIRRSQNARMCRTMPDSIYC